MTKEELTVQKDEIYAKINSLEIMVRDLKGKSRQLSLDYIEEHREFQNGDLVNVTHDEWNKRKTEKAFIDSAQEYNGKITYNFLQVKKDGTPSSRKLYVYYYHDSENGRVAIELINTDYRNKNFDGTPKNNKQ